MLLTLILSEPLPHLWIPQDTAPEEIHFYASLQQTHPLYAEHTRNRAFANTTQNLTKANTVTKPESESLQDLSH